MKSSAICPVCGKAYVPKTIAKACSPACRKKRHFTRKNHWRKAHPEAHRAQNRRWYKSNAKRRSAQIAAYQKDNPAKRNEWKARWRQRHAAKMLPSHRAWMKTDRALKPDKYASIRRKHRTGKRVARMLRHQHNLENMEDAMAVKQSQINKKQNDVLAAFVAALHETQRSIGELALRYKACIDAGCDMSRFEASEGHGFGMRLLKVAEGKLLPRPMTILAQANTNVIHALCTLPMPEQQRLLDGGLPVRRKGKTHLVPLCDVTRAQVKQAIDVVGGRGRILTPDEQTERTAKPAPKKDMLVSSDTMRLEPFEIEQIRKKADKAGRSFGLFLKSHLYETGVLAPRDKRNGSGAHIRLIS